MRTVLSALRRLPSRTASFDCGFCQVFVGKNVVLHLFIIFFYFFLWYLILIFLGLASDVTYFFFCILICRLYFFYV